jgi:hypothetical protein
MKYAVICDDPAHMPWVIPADGDDPLSVAVEQAEGGSLIRPVMVIDYEGLKAWRVGRDEDGWYLSDSASVKMGLMTEPEHVTRDLGAVCL